MPQINSQALSVRERAIVALVLELTGQLERPPPLLPASRRAQPDGLADLTRRERDVLPLLLSGLTTKQIAIELKLRPKTVTSYRARILQKLGVRTSMQLSHLFHGVDVAGLFECGNNDTIATAKRVRR
jgi:DNA-binding CsgD family transcriptional regulator